MDTQKHGPGFSLLNRLVFLLPLILAACSDADAITGSPEGIDVSHYQGDVVWSEVRKSGVSFSYIKVSEGITITDQKLSANWDGAHKAGILRGGYHTFAAGDDGAAQAQHFLNSLSLIKADHNGALPPVLDIEAIPKDKLHVARGEIKNWLEFIEEKTGCAPIIYTSPETWNGEYPDEFNTYKLWLANYAETPRLPRGWKSWTFWQRSNTGSKGGIKGNVDLDSFAGNEIDLLLHTCIGW